MDRSLLTLLTLLTPLSIPQMLGRGPFGGVGRKRFACYARFTHCAQDDDRVVRMTASWGGRLLHGLEDFGSPGGWIGIVSRVGPVEFEGWAGHFFAVFLHPGTDGVVGLRECVIGTNMPGMGYFVACREEADFDALRVGGGDWLTQGKPGLDGDLLGAEMMIDDEWWACGLDATLFDKILPDFAEGLSDGLRQFGGCGCGFASHHGLRLKGYGLDRV